MRLSLVLLALVCSACALDWDRFDPRRADGSATDAPAADVVPVDVGPCGDPGLQCCAGGTCRTGSICTSTVCTACPAGQIACSGACVDVQVSNDHCGRCGVQCRGMRVCTMGNCQ
ncbi:MAG: hypothetical protein JNK05_00955 [Myxococcales bacterium]|nr:hypothetical protein [Myxococcales bacterium]